VLLVLPDCGSVAMIVPLINDTSKVDVAVTVTVCSSVLVVISATVPLTVSDSVRGGEVELEVKDVMVDESPREPDDVIVEPVEVVLFDMGGMVTDTAVVNEPTSVRETTAPVLAAGTSVTMDVEVPSLTFT
jgi:hypothetical protein